MKSHQCVLSLLGSLSLLPLSLFPMAIVQAQPIVPTTPGGLGVISADFIEKILYNAPDLDDRGAPPGRIRGIGSRGDGCPERAWPPLTAIVPATQGLSNRDDSGNGTPNTEESVLSLTTQARPTLWFYVPYDLDTFPLIFAMQDQDGNILYETSLSSREPDHGIVQVTWPESGPNLQVNTRYQWYLTLDCDPIEFVHGWIDRVPLDANLSNAIADATPRDQAAIYASNGLWQEAITLLGELYLASPNNTALANDWYNLLESVDLEEVAQAPLVDCCRP